MFVNKIERIIHDCAERWGGFPTENIGEISLITWKLPNIDEYESEEEKEAAIKETSKLAMKALLSAIKMNAEIERSIDVKIYAKHPRIRNKYNFNMS